MFLVKMHKMEKLQLRLLVEHLEQLHSIGQQVQEQLTIQFLTQALFQI